MSIYFGETAASNSLIFFGIQSAVEVISAGFVVWRFLKVAPPGEEGTAVSDDMLKKERYATIGIGILFGILTVGTWVTSIISLVKHNHPDTSTPSLIISASALALMILIWLPKPWLAKTLNSSAMHGEAKCSLACIYITAILLIGTLVYKFWENGWWVDSAIAILLGAFFAKESLEMIRWGTSKEFSGGCCDSCNMPESKHVKEPTPVQESEPEANPCVDIKCCSGCDK